MSHSLNAAQYLRMSTEHQQYSVANQADAIARYAEDHGFTIVKTYADPAKSGLRLKNREALKQLLKDVVAGSPGFQAVLVYDVSRWGRFQDTDEAAHYEYLCKSSGVPVYYCVELFANDNSLATLIMKALKRCMAGEYSRELSVKVRAGLARLTRYKAGGIPPYGMRRLLIDSFGHGKLILTPGERKSLLTDRVILTPGPPAEVRTVRRIFREFVYKRHSMPSIARGLDRDGIRYKNGGPWSAHSGMTTTQEDKSGDGDMFFLARKWNGCHQINGLLVRTPLSQSLRPIFLRRQETDSPTAPIREPPLRLRETRIPIKVCVSRCVS